MRVTVDLDPQTGQSGISTMPLAAPIGQPGGLNGGAANIPGVSGDPGAPSLTPSLPAQNGGGARSIEQGSDSSSTQAQDGGAAPV